MKKVFFAILAIVATMTIASCGNGSTSTAKADSTAVANVTDATKVDSTATPAQVDSVQTK